VNGPIDGRSGTLALQGPPQAQERSIL